MGLEEMIMEVKSENGELNFVGFLGLMAKGMNDQASKEAELQVLNKAFGHFDKEKKGKLTRADIVRGATDLGETLTDKEIDDMIRNADDDNDGFITREEFINMMSEA